MKTRRIFTKLMAACLAVLCLALFCGFDFGNVSRALAAKTGWVKVNGSWYYYDTDGEAVTGWQKISRKWYYMNESGVMKTGWQKIGGKYYYLGTDGAMKTGWKKVGKYWYYMDKSGVMKTGWVKSSGKYYYLKSSGAMKTGWLYTKGKYYYLDPAKSGAMATGWKDIDSVRYYFNTDGSMAKGWKSFGNDVYYFDKSGAMLKSCIMDGYAFADDGKATAILKDTVIRYGAYEQSSDLQSAEQSPIEWIVADVKDDKALLVSKYILDVKQYNDDENGEYAADTNWSECSLRAWLNDESEGFIARAFNAEELERILTTEVTAMANPDFEGGNPGPDTEDKVFLLSVEEAALYFPTDEERIGTPTAFAAAIKEDFTTRPCWWTRCPSYNQNCVTLINQYGNWYDGDMEATWLYGVRPAMWIDIDD